MKRHRGFTVLELLTVLGIFVVLLSVAAGLILESQARMARSGRQALDPATEIILEQIRTDCRASSGLVLPFGGGFDDWYEDEPMELTNHYTGLRVVYEAVGDQLRRRLYKAGPFDELIEEKVMFKSLVSWRWRLFPGVPYRAAQLELEVLETAAFTARTAAGQRELAPVTETLELLAFFRRVQKYQW